MKTLARRGPVESLLTFLTWIGVFVMFAPIAWMILTSFKSEQDAVSSPPKLFFTPTLESLKAGS
jgi:sorbitol/mannitol transport system permease protein